MIVLTDKNTNVIIDIVETAETVTNGLQVTKDSKTYIYANVISVDLTQTEKETITEGVKAQAYKLVNGDFVVNPDYVAEN